MTTLYVRDDRIATDLSSKRRKAFLFSTGKKEFQTIKWLILSYGKVIVIKGNSRATS